MVDENCPTRPQDYTQPIIQLVIDCDTVDPETVPSGFTPFEAECPEDLGFAEQDYVPGGRTVVVVPYDADVESGQLGTFQVISGMGGQVCQALYLGDTAGRRSDPDVLCYLPGHAISARLDDEVTSTTDIIKRDPEVRGGPKGDRGIAIRDRGVWYVVKLGSEAETVSINVGVVLGGNIPVPTSEIPTVQPIEPNVINAIPMGRDFSVTGLPIEDIGKELLTDEPEAGYYTDDTTDPVEDNGLRAGIGVAYRYTLDAENTDKELIYIVNRLAGIAMIQGQPIFLINEIQVPLLDEDGEPRLDEDDVPLTATIFEAIG